MNHHPKSEADAPLLMSRAIEITALILVRSTDFSPKILPNGRVHYKLFLSWQSTRNEMIPGVRQPEIVGLPAKSS
ncbi:hypothetical protein [Microcoleus sp. CAWBG58]|uniref:hypothetical protein n=1 Tax=Microcoleus sp. CAWBG58 TaxID=2841651 RepID=UPI0025DE98B4|nr:hypothetical protein [Microcoleus sp. CAWBG58]